PGVGQRLRAEVLRLDLGLRGARRHGPAHGERLIRRDRVVLGRRGNHVDAREPAAGEEIVAAPGCRLGEREGAGARADPHRGAAHLVARRVPDRHAVIGGEPADRRRVVVGVNVRRHLERVGAGAGVVSAGGGTGAVAAAERAGKRQEPEGQRHDLRQDLAHDRSALGCVISAPLRASGAPPGRARPTPGTRRRYAAAGERAHTSPPSHFDARPAYFGPAAALRHSRRSTPSTRPSTPGTTPAPRAGAAGTAAGAASGRARGSPARQAATARRNSASYAGGNGRSTTRIANPGRSAMPASSTTPGAARSMTSTSGRNRSRSPRAASP